MENPESTTSAGDEVKVTLSKEEYDKLVGERATDKQSIANVVEELKELRKKLKTDAPKETPKANEDVITSQADVERVIQKKLDEQKIELRQSNYTEATNEFLAAHPEFSSENDPGGLKLSAFQKALSKINLQGLETKQQFSEAFMDAVSLMSKDDKQSPMNPSSSPQPAPIPKTVAVHNLPPAEEKLVKTHFNGDVAKYLAQKAKKPAYFEELLKWAR